MHTLPINLQEEKAACDAVLREFHGLTNDEAYFHVFAKRMMEPVSDRVGEYYGCDQRLYMMPPLQQLVAVLPPKSQVFDVGAGAGDAVDFALKGAPQGTTIHFEEPNPAFVKAYLQKLKMYPHLKVGVAFQGTLQECYQSSKVAASSQNLILAIHMIYHLTDFLQPNIDPEADLIEAMAYLYDLLAPGGTLFVVYADLETHDTHEAMCGLGEKFFRAHYPNENYADHLLALYKSRNRLLGPKGTLDKILKERFPNTTPKLEAKRVHSHFFGPSIADIAVLALAAELCPSNAEPFDLRKLQFCLEYILMHPERIGLEKEERDVPQKGLWRASEPQVIATIRK